MEHTLFHCDRYAAKIRELVGKMGKPSSEDIQTILWGDERIHMIENARLRSNIINGVLETNQIFINMVEGIDKELY